MVLGLPALVVVLAAVAEAGEEVVVEVVAVELDSQSYLFLSLICFLAGVAITMFLVVGVVEGKLQLSGFVLGFVLLALPFFFVVVFTVLKFFPKKAGEAGVLQRKKLVGMIKAKGVVSVDEVVLELDITRERFKELVYDLVRMGLFTGAVDWSGGRIISKEFSEELKKKEGMECPSCGARLAPGGRGVLHCDYCGADVFL